MNGIWPRRIGLASLSEVRGLAFAAVLFASAAQASPQSNPAFLGITMDTVTVPQSQKGYQPTQLKPVGCVVQTVVPGSAAEAAGVHQGDIIFQLDDVSTMDTNTLNDQIVAHHPGDTVRLEVMRGVEHVTLQAILLTRAEVLNRRFVGHPFESVEVTDAENGNEFDVSALRGKARVVAWFDSQHCSDCDVIIRRVESQLEKVHNGPSLLAVTDGNVEQIAQRRLAGKLGVPLAVADKSAFERNSMNEDRAYFMVVDARGVVRFITPIAPDGEDVDASIDEVIDAAEQTEHARRHRG
jgi:hypothetical protein